MTTAAALSSLIPTGAVADLVGAALNKFQQQVSRDDPYRAMVDLTAQLAEVRTMHGPGTWTEAAHSMFLNHPASDIILQDPMTRHAVARPRGYAGDAVLLDYIYEHPDMREQVVQASSLGATIMRHNLDSSVALAVRSRANILAARMTALGRRSEPTEVLSVASGHLREVERLEPEAASGIGRLVAFDQDEASLDVALTHRERVPSLDVVRGSVVEILRGRRFGSFDLIYAAGLTDYLPERLVRRLAVALFQNVKPGGRLLLGNFLTGTHDAGYMEICMNWRILHRDRTEILGFFSDLPAGEIASVSFFTDPAQRVGYAEVERAEEPKS